MRHLQVGKRTVRKTAASVGEHQIRRLSFSDVAAFVRISHLAQKENGSGVESPKPLYLN